MSNFGCFFFDRVVSSAYNWLAWLIDFLAIESDEITGGEPVVSLTVRFVFGFIAVAHGLQARVDCSKG